MAKINVILVALNSESLQSVATKLNFKRVNVTGIIADISDKKTFKVGKSDVTIFPFSKVKRIAKTYTKVSAWLVCDCLSDTDDFRKLKNFLTTSDVPEDKILGTEIFEQPSPTWSANVYHVEKYGADFFATGDECMRDGLNLKFIPCVHENKIFSRGGANLSDAKQDLQQSYLTAKHVFRHAKSNTVKFVLIGLTPESFLCENKPPEKLHLPLTDSANAGVLIGDDKNISSTPKTKPDLNFSGLKAKFRKSFSLLFFL